MNRLSHSHSLGGSNRGVKKYNGNSFSSSPCNNNNNNNSLRTNNNNNNNNSNHNNYNNSPERVLLPIMFLVALGLLLFVAVGIVVLNVHVLLSSSILSKSDCSTSNISSPLQLLLTKNNNNINNKNNKIYINGQQQEQLQLCIDSTYGYMKQNQTIGLTDSDYERSRSHIGNRKRLSYIVQKLVSNNDKNINNNKKQRHQQQQQQQQPLAVLVCGGSISLGHGVEPPTARYSDQLEVYFNTYFPILETQGDKKNNNKLKHRVYNKGSHGADMCSMAKRINTMDIPSDPDLFILEFAVNDYQGQDHKVHIDHKTDIFFEGFQRLALCAEVVVYKLLTTYPKAAIVFLEFQTAILNRKNAQLLHMGVAQHYNIPVISYADTMFKPYYNLIQKLDPTNLYSTVIDDSILSYPHGCSPCILEGITSDFRPYGCKSVCTFMNRSGYQCDFKIPVPSGRQPCYTSFLSHDAVHPSVVGHQIARDLIVQALADTAKDMCIRKNQQQQQQEGALALSIIDQDPVLPVLPYYENQYIPDQIGWMAPPDTLKLYSEFIMVKDTMEMFANQDPLTSNNYSTGFQLTGDGTVERKGWICTSSNGNEYIEFTINLPTNQCYVVYIAALKSYEGMGMFTVELFDIRNNNNNNNNLGTPTATVVVDGIWEPHISIPADIIINSDNRTNPACTGRCIVRIRTHPIINGRSGNKVKIMTLSVRKCISASSMKRQQQRRHQEQPLNNIQWLLV